MNTYPILSRTIPRITDMQSTFFMLRSDFRCSVRSTLMNRESQRSVRHDPVHAPRGGLPGCLFFPVHLPKLPRIRGYIDAQLAETFFGIRKERVVSWCLGNQPAQPEGGPVAFSLGGFLPRTFWSGGSVDVLESSRTDPMSYRVAPLDRHGGPGGRLIPEEASEKSQAVRMVDPRLVIVPIV